MKRVQLKEKEERRVLRGHLWVYRNELDPVSKLDDGDLVDLYTARGRFVGRGFYQARGGIAVRMMTPHQEDVDGRWLARRIDEAVEFRQALFPGQTVYRWIFGESDGLAGLVADRYGSVVVASSSCAFYKTVREDLAQAFLAHAGVDGVRLSVCDERFPFGDAPDLLDCRVNGFDIRVDFAAGQKSGLFLDQRENWRAVGPYAPGARVLDGHCYVGLWSLHAARAGAASVLGVDTSEPALARARENARRNGLDHICRFERADVMDALSGGEKYDLIILDPPALAKSRAQEGQAATLHQRMNKLALLALNPGGVLITSSCSHFVRRERFLEALKRAAVSARRRVWLLDVRGAAPDHPVLMAMPETEYLNCVTIKTPC